MGAKEILAQRHAARLAIAAGLNPPPAPKDDVPRWKPTPAQRRLGLPGDIMDREAFLDDLLDIPRFHVDAHYRKEVMPLMTELETLRAQRKATTPPAPVEPLKPGESAVARIAAGGQLTTQDYETHRAELLAAEKNAEIDRAIAQKESERP
jgi:hypothetical protein